MTVSFFKLHVCGDDFILIDRARTGHELLREKTDLLAVLARNICDRYRGVGACGVVYLDGSQKRDNSPNLFIRIFDRLGKELSYHADAFLCVARWAFDSGQSANGKIQLQTLSDQLILSALDSRSFAFEMAAPVPDGVGRLDMLLDGRPETAFLLRGQGYWAASIGHDSGPSPARVREALAAAVPGATPVITRLLSRDLIRFSTVSGADRTAAAAAAVRAGIQSGRIDSSAVAEWRGKGSAVAYAHFSDKAAASITGGPGTLIDRGRFFVQTTSDQTLLIAGVAEYVFDGSYDWDYENT